MAVEPYESVLVEVVGPSSSVRIHRPVHYNREQANYGTIQLHLDRMETQLALDRGLAAVATAFVEILIQNERNEFIRKKSTSPIHSNLDVCLPDDGNTFIGMYIGGCSAVPSYGTYDMYGE